MSKEVQCEDYIGCLETNHELQEKNDLLVDKLELLYEKLGRNNQDIKDLEKE